MFGCHRYLLDDELSNVSNINVKNMLKGLKELSRKRRCITKRKRRQNEEMRREKRGS